jgi:hypothetical protein
VARTIFDSADMTNAAIHGLDLSSCSVEGTIGLNPSAVAAE